MKRYISLACVFLVVIMCMVSPVSAADSDFEFFDILDYTSVNESGNFFSFSGETVIGLKLPFQTNLYYVDILFTCNNLVSISAIWNNSSNSLSILQLSDNTYRAYGTVPSGNYYYLDLLFSNNGTSYITLLSCKVSCIPLIANDIECYCNISANDYNKTIHFIPSDEINYRIFTGTDSDITLSGYNLFIWSDDWRKYDYIDFLLTLTVDSINSISCSFQGSEVPISVSYISNDVMTNNDYNVLIRMDLRNLDRTSDDYPMIIVSGNVSMGHQNYVGILSCVGSVSQIIDVHSKLLNRIILSIQNLGNAITTQLAQFQTALSVHFSNLNSWITTQTAAIQSQFTLLKIDLSTHFSNLDSWLDIQTNILESAIRGDTSPGDSFQQEVDQKDQQLNDMAAVMDSVNKPQIDSVNVSADTYVDQTVLATSMSGLTAVISMPVFLDVIMMALIMATAGYVLFGKR